MPSLSIIVPVYNSEKYLENTVRSVLSQTYQDFELLLVDDGSTDKSLALCQQFAQEDQRIQVFTKKNGGVSSARNFGLERASGRYIAFLDGDDCLDAVMYEWLIQALEKEQADLSGCWVIKETTYTPTIPEKKKKIISTEPILLWVEKKGFIDSSLNKVYRRELIGSTRFPEDVSYSEDKLFVTEVLLKAKKMVLLPNYFYHYIQHANSLSWQDTYSVWEGNFKVHQQIYQKMQQRDVQEPVKISAFRGYVKSIIALLRYDVKYQQRDLYQQTLRQYKPVLQQYLQKTKLPLGKRLEYLTYTTSWGLADFVHYRLKRRK